MKDFENFVKLHAQQLISSGIPQHLWTSLNNKLQHEIFDAQDVFELMIVDYDGVQKSEEDPTWLLQLSKDIKCTDPDCIYLIDHAWSFRLNDYKEELKNNRRIVDRINSIMRIPANEDTIITDICSNLWQYCNYYSLENAESAEDRVPIWYVMDELGSAIQHSDEPNFRCLPFLYLPEKICFSIIFPICDVTSNSVVTRDYAETSFDKELRTCHLLPWFPKKFEEVDFAQEEPDDSYFSSRRMQETLPIANVSPVLSKHKIKVYSEYQVLIDNLTNPNFELVEDQSDADILWLVTHYKSFASLNTNSYINQFPYEHLITVKDLLSVVCRRAGKNGAYPPWLPITYNLETELAKFISLFKDRIKKKQNNIWICKPWNMARAIDTYVTDNLNQIIRIAESGPKIAQKYIDTPVTFLRRECGEIVKFDIRYVILLKSVKPLVVSVYRRFFLRFANESFDLNDLENYEKHFTVMNYRDDADLHHMKCDEFIKEWGLQYPDSPWCTIEKDIDTMLKEMLTAATTGEMPKVIGHSPQSRALYAADIMLSWQQSNIQPMLLEVNWLPDCKRACQYYPNFYNDIFNYLFLDIEDDNVFRRL